MLKICILLLLVSGHSAYSQTLNQPPSSPTPESSTPAQSNAAKDKNPQVRYTYLNVCTPSDDDQKQMRAVLTRIPGTPRYNPDFEISRGRTSLANAQPARYLRLRRELSNQSEFNHVQYSLSTDATDTHETLVLKVKDAKDLLMVSLEDKVSSSATSPSSLLDADTPVTHIKLERFGKPSLALARCEGSDQSAYAPLFKQASGIFAAYRKSLGLRSTFRNDLNWLVTPGATAKQKSEAKAREGHAKGSDPANSLKSEPQKPD